MPAYVIPALLQKGKGKKKIKRTDCEAFQGGDLASNPISNHLINSNYVPFVLSTVLWCTEVEGTPGVPCFSVWVPACTSGLTQLFGLNFCYLLNGRNVTLPGILA